MKGNSWNDGHLDGIGEAIVGLSLVLFIAVLLLWPLTLPKGKKGSGGCCKAIDTELNNDK